MVYIDEEKDQWISEAISLNYKRQVDIKENPLTKLQNILKKVPSSASIDLSQPNCYKAIVAIHDFIKRGVVEMGKNFDGEIPEPLHHHWIEVAVAFENIDLDMKLGRDFIADLKLFLSHAKNISEDLIKMDSSSQ